MFMNNFECEQFLELTLSLGRQYVETGAEIKRVEDSLYRIYNAYGFENIEIYAITSLIVVTIKGPDGTHYTQSVRVTSGGTDLGRLEDINALIRYICTNKPRERGALLAVLQEVETDLFVLLRLFVVHPHDESRQIVVDTALVERLKLQVFLYRQRGTRLECPLQ